MQYDSSIPGSKPRTYNRKPNHLHPTFTSSLVTELMKPYELPKLLLPKKSTPQPEEALQSMKMDFQNKKIGQKVEQQRENTARNRQQSLQSRASNQTPTQQNEIIPNKPVQVPPGGFNYNNEEAIYRKQAKGYNIISMVPVEVGHLREYHNLTSEDRLWLKHKDSLQLKMYN